MGGIREEKKVRKIAYGIFTSRSRGLPVAVFNSKWHAEGYMQSLIAHKARGMHIKRIWFATEDKHVFTVSRHLSYRTEVKA